MVSSNLALFQKLDEIRALLIQWSCDGNGDADNSLLKRARRSFSFAYLNDVTLHHICEYLGGKDLQQLCLAEHSFLHGPRLYLVAEKAARALVMEKLGYEPFGTSFEASRSAIHQRITTLQKEQVSNDTISHLPDSVQIDTYLSWLDLAKHESLKAALTKNGKTKLLWSQMAHAVDLARQCPDSVELNRSTAACAYSTRFNNNTRDGKATLRCLVNSAILGNPLAQFDLAVSTIHGDGVEQSFEMAIFWLQRAAPYLPIAAFCLATSLAFPESQCCEPRIKYEVKVDPVIVQSLLLFAAEAGFAPAQVNIGIMYHGNFPFPKDCKSACEISFEKAIYWWEKAASQNQVEALLNLGHAYKRGQGVDADERKAFQLWMQAANADDSRAHFLVGQSYFNGFGVDPDFELAKEHLRRSIDTSEDGKTINAANEILQDILEHEMGE